jgi:hypothetical protein
VPDAFAFAILDGSVFNPEPASIALVVSRLAAATARRLRKR